MSNGDVRRVSVQDIQLVRFYTLVQNLIERCLQLYMSQGEVVSTLLQQAKIEPGFTELVWQKLEAENQDFFKAYHMRLIIKDQILQFNQLLERQVELMRQICSTGATFIPPSNGSHIQSTYQAPRPTGLSIKPENMLQAMSVVPNAYTNGAHSMQQRMQVAVNMMGDTGRIDVPSNTMSVQGSNTLMRGMNGGIIKSEVGYGGDSPYMFGSESNLLESRNVIGEGSVPHFDGVEPSSHTLNETILDPEMNTFGFLGQIPRNFSLSDLTADFSNSTDILENYSKSPFLGTDANFMGPRLRDDQQADIRRLDTISEGLSYQDFGGE
ncbi:uncharacterized protein [Primulina eburnea]|uniref:uncharacterized protein isoform X1 n=1 Tax=Primulina eburnea TaxID=1245227 RepID=UPI003C6C6120